ncbi:uncharacterized protein PpBr36_10354, partial [Pyricularia pennisetigena]|uniref:uncharacterized protein n=1 Tax=Pyricularia pennisetigena TaxID=1578925 RepID=UPI001151F73E
MAIHRHCKTIKLLQELSNFPLTTTIPETSGHIRTNEANLISNSAQLVGSHTDQVIVPRLILAGRTPDRGRIIVSR